MKRLFILFILCVIGLAAFGQDVANNRNIMNKIKESGNYLFASSTSDSLDLALDEAVLKLGSQIMTNVKSVSDLKIDPEGKILYEQVSKTFTNVKLSDYQSLVVGVPEKKSKLYTVFVYISKERVDGILEEIREQEVEAKRERDAKLSEDVRFYYAEGNKAVNDLRIGDALKYYYWSYVLSLGSKVTLTNGHNEEPATRLLESQIEAVLNGVKVDVTSFEKVRINEFQEKYKLVLNIQYVSDGLAKNVTNLDFEYNDGNIKQRGPRVRDGVGVMELQYDMSEVRFQCIYRYDENETPPDIYEVINDKSNKKFESANKFVTIPGSVKAGNAIASVDSETSTAAANLAATATDAFDHDEMQRRMELIENAIRGKNYASVRNFFTDEGYDCFKKLIQYGNASIVRSPVEFRFLDFGDLTLCRQLTMQFRFRNNKQFIEDVSFRFNHDNMVESIAFNLSDVAENSILENGKWKRDSRLTLMTFLEDYQTAYALGRIDYLERIFSENALIIVGNKVEKKVLSDGIVITESVKYDTLSKAKYMERLRGHFRTKEYINLNFTDTDFARASNGKEFYGIRVRQEYFSSNYGDVGYLFLLVDLRFDEPIIHVRAWQNDKLPMEDLFDLSDCY